MLIGSTKTRVPTECSKQHVRQDGEQPMRCVTGERMAFLERMGEGDIVSVNLGSSRKEVWDNPEHLSPPALPTAVDVYTAQKPCPHPESEICQQHP